MAAILLLCALCFLCVSARNAVGDSTPSLPSGGRMRRLMQRSGISRSWMGVAGATSEVVAQPDRQRVANHPLQGPLAAQPASFPILSRQRERDHRPNLRATHCLNLTPQSKTRPQTSRRPLFTPAGVSTCVNLFRKFRPCGGSTAGEADKRGLTGSWRCGSELARPAGFEPATGRVEVGNSIQLSYGRVDSPLARFAANGNMDTQMRYD